MNTIANQEELQQLEIILKEENSSTVYVVANTNDPKWGLAFDSLQDLEKASLSLTNPIYENDLKEGTRGIPMGGFKTDVAVGQTSKIDIHVERMFAKLKIWIEPKDGFNLDNIDLRSLEIRNIPAYCRVNGLKGSDDSAAKYPDNTNYNTWTFGSTDASIDESDGKKYFIIYVPENIKGEVADITYKNEGNAPDQSLVINTMFKYKYLAPDTNDEVAQDYILTVYPGGNNINNFNIVRNNVYRVKLIINPQYFNERSTPSSNCFVVKPGEQIAFEPYNRKETGGGFNINTYLDENNPDKVINSVEILWQTKDAIGDNSKGDLVRYVSTENIKRIYVKANKEGNALIAARNKDNKILWSWHIWITYGDVANVDMAQRYKTYEWDNTGIKTEQPRKWGRAIMSRNLGALADTPEEKGVTATYGMMYQWGRKDPFPPITNINTVSHTHYPYNEEWTGKHYGNDNTTSVKKTSGTSFDNAINKDRQFYSIEPSEIQEYDDPILHSVQFPTVFFCGKNHACEGSSLDDHVKNDNSNYPFQGDWMHKHDDTLWGGLSPDTQGLKQFDIKEKLPGNADKSVVAHIFNNYGEKKTIYDPCPAGWRVPPGELWLGFSETGLNPMEKSMINYNMTLTPNNGVGMYMYLQEFREGPYSFFPVQGTRHPDGSVHKANQCGNYHNATTDINNRVNILHIHNNATLFKIFEYSLVYYYVKSCAGPVRCVRDTE